MTSKRLLADTKAPVAHGYAAAPRPENDAGRVAVLCRYDIVDTPPEDTFDDIARLAALVCGAPIARVSFIDEARQWFKAEIGSTLRETPRDDSICAHAILGRELLVVPDLVKDPRFVTHPRVVGDPCLRFYAGAPLRTSEGYALGTLCVLDTKPHRLRQQQKNGLLALARQVMAQLELRRAFLRMARDERRRAGRSATQSEARYQSLVAATSAIVWRESANGELIGDAPSWEAFTGQTPARYGAGGWIDAVHPDDRERTAEMWQRALSDHRPSVGEYRLRRKDGQYRHMIVHGLPLFDDKGELFEWVGACSDVTEAKQAQLALQRKEHELSLITNAIPALIAHVGADQRFRFANRTYQQWCKQKGDKTIGKTVEEVVGESSYAAIAPHIDAVLSGKPVSFEREAVYRDGEPRFVHAQYLPDIDAAGVVHGFFALVTDISERHRAEQALARKERELQLVTDAMPALIAYIDTDRRYRFANRTYEQWFNVRREDVYGRTLAEVIGQPGFELVREHVDRALAGEAVQFERWMPYAHGPARWIQVNYIPDIAATGKVHGFFALVIDISERKHAEQRLQAQYAASRILATERDSQIAARELLQAICGKLRWDVGVAWRWGRRSKTLHCYDVWSADRAAFGEFESATRKLTFAPSVELPGRVWQQKTPLWISDVIADNDFPHAAAAESCGLRSAFAVPIRLGDQMMGVIEFFSTVAREPDTALLETMTVIGRDIGQFVARRRAEREIARLNADLEQREERLKLAQRAGGIGSFDFNFETGKLIWSDELEALFGMEPGGFSGETEAWIAAAHPHDRELVRAKLQASSDRDSEFEYRIVRADDAVRWMVQKGHTYCDATGAAKRMIGVVRDVTERVSTQAELARYRVHLEELVKERTAQLRELSAHLQSVREDEKRHIAREVHDELGGVLTGLKMDGSWLRRKLVDADASIQAKLDAMLQLVDAAIAAVRKIQTTLRPALLDDLGLVPALEWQAQDFERHSGIGCHVMAEIGEAAIAPARAIALFRVFQEALTNVARHANASRVNVRLSHSGDCVVMEISDDGRGMQSVRLDDISRHGLRGMRERALYLGGELTVESAAGGGTTVTIKLPDLPDARTSPSS